MSCRYHEGDWDLAGLLRLDRSIALEVLGRLSTTSTTATSYEGFSKAISASRDTAGKYLDALGDAFLVATISSFDTARGRVAPKKDRKFLWIDPAFRKGLLVTSAADRERRLTAAATLERFLENPVGFLSGGH